MSLLSDTSGTPERVLSLLQLLEAHGGSLLETEVAAWLNPPFVENREARATPSAGVDQTIGAARGLGFVATASGACALADGLEDITLPKLADLTHDVLIAAAADDADGVLPRVFAFVTARSEQARGTNWVHETNNVDFAVAVNAVFPQRDTAAKGRIFNEYRVAPFWRWMSFVGLGMDLAGAWHPYVAERLDIELRRSGLPRDVEIPVRDFLEVVRARMPYLDNGPLYVEVAGRLGLPSPARTLSPLLSTALRDLHEEGALKLGARPDAPGVLALTPDPMSPVNGVQFVILTPEAADA